MSKINLPVFLLTGVPLTEGRSSGIACWFDIIFFVVLGLLFLALVALLIVGIVYAFMWQPM